MEINQIIAQNLNLLRTERNLSLGQLAAATGVSKVMLSQIEKGETNPTINTLWKIANGLKVPYAALLEQRACPATLVRRAALPMQADDDTHYRLFCFYPATPHRNFELFQMELDPGCSHDTIGHSPRAQEYVMVLAGELELTVGGQSHRLGPDDALQFDADQPHRYGAGGQEVCRAVIINYYPA